MLIKSSCRKKKIYFSINGDLFQKINFLKQKAKEHGYTLDFSGEVEKYLWKLVKKAEREIKNMEKIEEDNTRNEYQVDMPPKSGIL